MDISDEVESKYLASQDIKTSQTKTIVLLNEGTKTEAKDSKGQTYISTEFNVQLDGQKIKVWRPSKHAKKILVKKFASSDTKLWVGKPIVCTTMLMQGGKEGVVPVE